MVASKMGEAKPSDFTDEQREFDILNETAKAIHMDGNFAKGKVSLSYRESNILLNSVSNTHSSFAYL